MGESTIPAQRWVPPSSGWAYESGKKRSNSEVASFARTSSSHSAPTAGESGRADVSIQKNSRIGVRPGIRSISASINDAWPMGR
ncbi:hypothetical protein ACFVXG_29230 [Kitasatospora sp. NPDC058162]|uniref:hypothetical protein n=1 Tax=Kitasatospora sp. NPDC058162 TaxID=3346362 RepID=UPI0036DF095B